MTIFPMVLGIIAITSVLLLAGCGQDLAGQATGEDVEDIGVLKQEVSAISSGLAELIGQIEEAIEALDASVSDLARSVEQILSEEPDQQPPAATGSTLEKPNGSPGPVHTPAPPGRAATSTTLLDWHLHREDGGDGDIEVSESGSTYAFKLVLWSQPSSDAVLSVVSDDTAQVTVSPGTLTFTSSNWDTAQTVTLTGVDDTDVDGDQTTWVTVSGVGGNWYASQETLWVHVEDDDGDIEVSESGSPSHSSCGCGPSRQLTRSRLVD